MRIAAPIVGFLAGMVTTYVLITPSGQKAIKSVAEEVGSAAVKKLKELKTEFVDTPKDVKNTEEVHD